MLHPQRYALMLKLKTSALNVSHCLNTWVDIESTARRRWEGVGRDGPVRRPADTRGLSIQAAFSHPFFAGRKVEEYMTDLHQVASVTTRHHAIRLQAGDRIGQVVFFEHELVPEDRSYAARGRYNGDTTVVGIKP